MVDLQCTPGARNILYQGSFGVCENRLQAVIVRKWVPAGGDALASDLIWRELRVLAEKKPVVASMGDVAASGGPSSSNDVHTKRFLLAEKLCQAGQSALPYST